MGLKVGTANLVIVTDPAYTHELFSRRGNIYSGRTFGYIPTHHIMQDQVDIHIAGMQPGAYLRKWRAAAGDLFNGPGQRLTRPMQEATASELCCRLLPQTTTTASGDDEALARLKHWALATPLLAITGQRLEDRGQGFSDRFFSAQEQWIQLLAPGSAPPVDLVVPLRWVPERWAEWKRKAKYVRAYMVDEYYSFLETAKSLQRADGGGGGGGDHHHQHGHGLLFRSLMTKVLDDEEAAGMEDDESARFGDADVAFFGGGLLDAAVDTTLAIVSSLVLFMATHPEAQARAYAEIDGLGSQNPPTGTSIADLPYLRACLFEVSSNDISMCARGWRRYYLVSYLFFFFFLLDIPPPPARTHRPPPCARPGRHVRRLQDPQGHDRPRQRLGHAARRRLVRGRR